MEKYDVVVVGAGAGGVFLTYELCRRKFSGTVLVLEKGAPLEQRHCPISEGKTETCVKCNPCRVRSGYGGAGTLSDGKYNITTRFGGDLHKYVGEKRAMELMEYVDEVLTSFGGADAKLYSTENSELKTKALQHDLHLLDAKVRHLGTDRNRQILHRLYVSSPGWMISKRRRTDLSSSPEEENGSPAETSYWRRDVRAPDGCRRSAKSCISKR